MEQDLPANREDRHQAISRVFRQTLAGTHGYQHHTHYGVLHQYSAGDLIVAEIVKCPNIQLLHASRMTHPPSRACD